MTILLIPERSGRNLSNNHHFFYLFDFLSFFPPIFNSFRTLFAAHDADDDTVLPSFCEINTTQLGKQAVSIARGRTRPRRKCPPIAVRHCCRHGAAPASQLPFDASLFVSNQRAALYFLPFSFCFSFAVVRESSSFVLARAKTSPNGEMGKGRWREGLSICKMLLEEIGKHQSINQTPKRSARGNKRCEKVFAGLFFFRGASPVHSN